jgi:hypothetical protein
MMAERDQHDHAAAGAEDGQTKKRRFPEGKRRFVRS